jgi:hypothetical protein
MKKKYLVEVWEHRQVSFEVEAENEEEAKKVAEDVYQNDDGLQHEMVSNDESIACEEVKVLQELGPATGIINTK